MDSISIERQKDLLHPTEPLMEKFLGYLRMIQFKAHLEKNDRVIDIGCGETARLLMAFHKKVSRIVGMDRKPCIQKLPPKASYLQLSYQDPWPFGQEFTVAMMSASFHVIPREQSAALLTKIRSILAKNGRLMLTFPTPQAKKILEVLALKLKWLSPELNREQCLFYTKSTITEVLENSGFHLKSFYHFQMGMNSFVVAEKR